MKMKPRAISNTLSFANNFFTPAIIVIPQISSHEDHLLAWIARENNLISQPNIINKSNYIVINQNNENVGIEMVRELIQMVSYGSYEGSERIVCILNADTATLPAQNALLKLLEEPPISTRIFLSVTNPDKLLETILSRCLVKHLPVDISPIKSGELTQKEEQYEESAGILQQIKTLSYREVLELAEAYKERAEAITILTQLLKFLHQNLQKHPTQSVIQRQLQCILQSLQGLEKNGNVRLILEDCFFSLKGLK